MRILLAEDDQMIGSSLVRGLRDEGYAVDWARDGRQAEAHLQGSEVTYRLALLDWNLPGRSGLDLIKMLRARTDPLPVLLITARDAIDDRILGLDSGADDYLVKPFEMGELKARMRALIRRLGERAESGAPLMNFGSLQIDPARHAVTRSGRSAALTPREFSLLTALMERPGRVLSRRMLEERMYAWDEEIFSNVIDVLLHNIRQKLGPDIIENVRGVGWRMGKAD